MSAPRRARAVAATLALAAFAVGCGSEEKDAKPGPAKDTAACRAQWGEVAESVLGLDEDTQPSALASRWTSVIATVDYYANGAAASDCGTRLEEQVAEIGALRRFSEKLRPYDMTYQLAQVRASIDLYLHDDLPAPTTDESGKKVAPPGKVAVANAFRTLSQHAAAADADLQPGWAGLATADLDDAVALRTAVEGLDTLAQASPTWHGCEQALQVLVAAIRAQEGDAGSLLEDDPSDIASPAS